MSSRTDKFEESRRARLGRPWSLGARLTLWYAASAFTLVLAAVSILYWGLVQALQAEDDQTLRERVQVVRSLLTGTDAAPALEWEVESEWLGVDNPQVFIRISDDQGRMLIETPGMDALLPEDMLSEALMSHKGGGVVVRGPSGKTFRATRERVDRSTDGSPRLIDVAVDFSSDERVLSQYRQLLAAVLAGAALICWWIGYRIAHQGISPVQQVVAATRRVGTQTLNERICLDNPPAELAELVANFNAMLGRLEDSFGRLSRFSANLAHELRTPLHNLRGETEVALSQARTADEYREILSSNLEEYAELSKIVDSLLFIARAEDPGSEICRECLNIRKEMRSLVDFYEPLASEKGVTISLSGDRELDAMLDRALLQRALGNLISNAISYTPSGGRVDLIAHEGSHGLRIDVRDTGCGISEDHLPHVFERFYRADGTRARASGGTGLGLSIVKTAVEMHGGDVSIASRVGQGTEVTLLFPNMTKS